MTHRPTLVAALLLTLGTAGAFAQSSLPAPLPGRPASGASAPAATAPNGPRLRSPSETGNRATAPGELRPERPVAPQISIPLGKKLPPPTRREERAVRHGQPVAGAVDDAAARCESQTDERIRAACRVKPTREAKGKLPN